MRAAPPYRLFKMLLSFGWLLPPSLPSLPSPTTTIPTPTFYCLISRFWEGVWEFLYRRNPLGAAGLSKLSLLSSGHFESYPPNKMAVEGFQYVALHSFTKDQEEDLDLQPGDLLTVSKASLLSMDNYSDGCEEQPEHLGWLLGYNERTKQRGDFPGTYVKFVGSMKMALPSIQPRSQRPLPAAPRPDSSQGRIFYYLTSKNLVIFKNHLVI